MLNKGQVVFSKCGRDKGRIFIVIASEGEYAYISDGDMRKLSTLKKKKLKHIQHTKYIDYVIQNKLEQNTTLLDADIRKALKAYKEIRNEEVNNFV